MFYLLSESDIRTEINKLQKTKNKRKKALEPKTKRSDDVYTMFIKELASNQSDLY